FLSPWFSGKSKREIYESSKLFSESCPYSLDKEHIEINPKWRTYFTRNAKILKHYCLWNLTLYLQDRNPLIPDIPNKLIKPAERQALNEQRRQYWDIVIREKHSLRCIYTNSEMTIGNYHVEHFLPYSFVSHNLIWNLIPADTTF